MPTHYRFLTRYRITTGPQPVWDLITDPGRLAQVWRWLDHVEIHDHTPDGVPRLVTYAVRAPFGYRLRMRGTLVDAREPELIELTISGDLDGHARFAMAGVPDERSSTIEFDLDVVTTPSWMDLLAPIARPVFEQGHRRVMADLGEELAEALGAGVTAFDSEAVLGRRLDTGELERRDVTGA